MFGGEAAIYDHRGKCLAYDARGRDRSLTQGPGPAWGEAIDWLAVTKPTVLKSSMVAGAKICLLPLGESLLLALNNEATIETERALRDSLREALPIIARVVGGEGVIFDGEGRRLITINPTGEIIPELGQGFSRYAMEAMRTYSVVIGPSTSVAGAMAVRLPLNREFGLGFNNELAVRQKNDLQEQINRDRSARYTFEDIIGDSEPIKIARQLAVKVAKSSSTVLIHGETGTGKEFFAQAIHNASYRSSRPFIAINCGAIPASLIESILFGYEPGAFTGASKEGRPGLFEQAQSGTLFLDEVSEMEFELQAKLLRVLQEQEVTRVGGKKILKIDVRVIASTNKDLEKLAAEGKFRQDLLFRLDVVRLEVPPLRERHGDIQRLAKYFVQKLNQAMGTYVTTIEASAALMLEDYPWPGNVRELQNCIERALNTTSYGVITTADLPYRISKSEPAVRPKKWTNEIRDLKHVLDQAERNHIAHTLRQVGGDKEKAAELLGISLVTMWRRMKKHGLN